MKVNGKDYDFKEDINISELLKFFNINPDYVVVEVDKEIIQKEDFNKKLKDKNRIEIVSFVGGG